MRKRESVVMHSRKDDKVLMSAGIHLSDEERIDEAAQEAARLWLRQLLDETRLTRKAMAAKIDRADSTISRPLMEPPKGLLTQETIGALATAFKKSFPRAAFEHLPPGRKSRGISGALLSGVEPDPTLSNLESIADSDRIPVWGALSAWRTGFFHLNRMGLGDIRRPPATAPLRHLAALRMPSDVMEPWRRMGEPLILTPAQDIGPGQHALVEVMAELDPNGEPMAFIAQRRPQGWYQYGPGEYLDLKGLKEMGKFRILELSEMLG